MSSSSSVQLLQHYLSVFKPRVLGKETDASVEIQLHEQISGLCQIVLRVECAVIEYSSTL